MLRNCGSSSVDILQKPSIKRWPRQAKSKVKYWEQKAREGTERAIEVEKERDKAKEEA